MKCLIKLGTEKTVAIEKELTLGEDNRIRPLMVSDYEAIVPVINEWWGGREMAHLLPRLFFEHFSNTSFIYEKDGKIVGFLVGLLSQSHPTEAYIHFVGVHPDHRKDSIGKQLYNEFFKVIKQHDRSIVRCITSPVNKQSIAFHTKMGFEAENSSDHNKVRFIKKL